MDLTLVALGVLVFARVLDIVALRGLAPESRVAIESALIRARVLSLVSLFVALIAGAIAYAVSPGMPAHLLILGVLVASILVQAILGGVSLVRAKTESRYTGVYVGSRLVSALAVTMLLIR